MLKCEESGNQNDLNVSINSQNHLKWNESNIDMLQKPQSIISSCEIKKYSIKTS